MELEDRVWLAPLGGPTTTAAAATTTATTTEWYWSAAVVQRGRKGATSKEQSTQAAERASEVPTQRVTRASRVAHELEIYGKIRSLSSDSGSGGLACCR